MNFNEGSAKQHLISAFLSAFLLLPTYIFLFLQRQFNIIQKQQHSSAVVKIWDASVQSNLCMAVRPIWTTVSGCCCCCLFFSGESRLIHKKNKPICTNRNQRIQERVTKHALILCFTTQPQLVICIGNILFYYHHAVPHSTLKRWSVKTSKVWFVRQHTRTPESQPRPSWLVKYNDK